MMNLPVPLIALLILLPVVSGPLLARMGDAARARRAATFLSATTLALAVGLALLAHRGEGAVADPAIPWLLGPSRSLFGVDRLSAPLLPFVALVTFALVVASPRGHASPASLGALLRTEGFTLAIFTSLDLGVLAVGWIMALLPGYRLALGIEGAEARARTRRTWAIFLALNALLLAAAVVVMAWWGASARVAAPLYLPGFQAPHDGRTATAVTVLLGLVVLIRSGTVPLHAWLPELLERGPFSSTVLLVVSQPGPYLLARLLIPSFSLAAGRPLALIVGLGLATALLGALAGLAQRDLKRIIAALALSQSGMILVGLCAGDTEGVAGALVQWPAIGVCVTGLSLCAAAVEARTGTSDTTSLGGLARHAPRLAALFLLFGVASVGFPGSLGFVAEDMLIHGLLESYPLVACGLVLVTVANGITVLRAYMRLFLGPSSAETRIADLLRRERFAALGLLLALLGFGLLPAGLVRAQADVAHSLALREGQVSGAAR